MRDRGDLLAGVGLILLAVAFFGALDTTAKAAGAAAIPVLTAGHLLLTPYLYLQIAFATLYGWLVFAHAPDLRAAAGIGLIAIGGVLGTWLTAREAREACRARVASGAVGSAQGG